MLGSPIFEAGEPQALGFCPERLGHITSVLADAVQRQHLPGAVAVVVRRGKLVLQTVVGVQNPQDGQAMAANTLFRIYSMTQPRCRIKPLAP